MSAGMWTARLPGTRTARPRVERNGARAAFDTNAARLMEKLGGDSLRRRGRTSRPRSRFGGKFMKQTLLKFLIVFVCTGGIIFGWQFSGKFPFSIAATVQAENTDPKVKTAMETAIENALYKRVEFFGTSSLVPFPTANARQNLADVSEKFPNTAEIFLKLSELDEKLDKFDLAGQEINKFVALRKDDFKAWEKLSDFYERRGEFTKEAEVSEKMLELAPETERAAIFSSLLDFARIHDLKEYLSPEFYQKTAAQNPALFSIIEQLIDRLTVEKNYPDALKILRGYRDGFPEKRNSLLEKEIGLLLSMKKSKEAEAVYQAAFDPFWSNEMTEKFYEFLKDQDRFRAYGSELKIKFKRDPADFETAVRLIDFQKNDGVYDNDSVAAVILRLEKARSEKNIVWKPEELVTAARLLLADGESDQASRFLYTLHLQHALEPKSAVRAKILYQLFELLSDSGEQRISLTKGDLRFYEDVGKSDPHPGITSGILSLIFSDTNPQRELAAKERTATKYFNRAAAYRIFQAYKEEYPTAPELAQMYLDIVRFYTAIKETEIAEKTLAEFEQRYEKSGDFPAVALKLADAFASTGQPEKERAVYQQILDYFGNQKKSLTPKIVTAEPQTDDDTTYSPPPSANQKPPISNQGIDIPSSEEKKEDYYYENQNSLHDYLADKADEINYSEILKRYVAVLNKDKQTEKILALYSNEINKYPDEQWLYEQRLEWLEQTNLVDEQLKVYQAAIARFKTRNWEDKLARWFLRQSREQEFAEFSQDLIRKLNDSDTQNYLTEFVETKVGAFGFDDALYLKLYTAAHERFPHNISFVNGLLNFYKTHKRENDWLKLSAEYYFESKPVRDLFVKNLAEKNELKNYLNAAREKCCLETDESENLPYALFRADAAAHFANFEEAVEAYQRLNELYPHTPEFQERLLSFMRSFGQTNRGSLAQAANFARAQADFMPSSAEFRTRSGELQAELGFYDNARNEWGKLIKTAQGDPENYLDAATLYWDYFQYDDALRTIKNLRGKMNDDTLYAFQTAAIMEARHKLPEAIDEYVKALGSSADENYSPGNRAKNRLIVIAGRKEENLRLINAAFEKERGRHTDHSILVPAYAAFLQEAKQPAQAETVLEQEILRSTDKTFLEAARDFFSERDNRSGEQAALRRLAQTTTSPRGAISYQLQFADSLLEENQRDKAKTAVTELLAKFPTNYGVLSESADIYWRMNEREAAIKVLQTGAFRGRGKFQYIFSRKLAAKLVLQNRLDEAERILLNLHDEDKTDTNVFRELTGIYVSRTKPDALEKVFGETLTALKNQDIERREFNAQTAVFRTQMIDAFTRMKNYRLAVEQHIEIINREPDDETAVENAVNYVKRYGGGDILLAYYQKTADQAYKNYRWNVVLARIFEANNDLDNAVRNYRTAIDNQPEMPELYVAVADIETRRQNYDAALENINKVLELSNDAPDYIKLKIKILEKAGRVEEAAAERAKLPAAEQPKQTISDRFQTAQNLQTADLSKSAADYRLAFDELLENPFAHDLRAADIAGYASALRTEENLDAISEKIWKLRDKFIAEADGYNAVNAGKARSQLQVLDGALPEAIGKIAKSTATGDENSALQKDLNRRIDTVFQNTDRYATLSLIQNVAHHAGYGALEEKILTARKDQAFTANDDENYHIRLRGLIDFYTVRGMYQKVLEISDAERGRDKSPAAFDYPRLIAENARLVGDKEKELAALREHYQTESGQAVTETDEMTACYLEFLYRNNRAELNDLTDKTSPHPLQLINFLLSKGERGAAHAAIENTTQPKSWKLARNAETSLALGEYADKNECYFCDALRLAPIGEYIKQRPDKTNELIGDDWFRLVGEYGEWLYSAPDGEAKNDAKNFLPAMIENNPQSADEQARLGVFYLTKNDPENALEHLRLAAEINPDDKNIKANLGAVYFLTNSEKKARDIWKEIIADENGSVEDTELYLQTLSKYGLQTQARQDIFPLLVKKLKEKDQGDNGYYQNDKQKLPADLKNFLGRLAKSFESETVQADYFQKLVSAVPNNTLLPEMLINDSLIAESRRAPFYEILIGRSAVLSSSDYEYEAVVEKTYSTREAEEVFDVENDFKVTEPEGEHLLWQKEYLIYLLHIGANPKAQNLLSEIENEINRRYARPEWLRLAEIRLHLRQGNPAKILEEAKHFVGIAVRPDTPSVKPPSVERLNDVLQILRDEKHDAEASDLLEAFYWRQLALEQYETANFIGLAQIFFEKNKAVNALEILRILNEAADRNTEPEALAKLTVIPQIGLYAVEGAKTEEIKAVDSINQIEALRLSAETCADFGQTDEAIAFRQKLIELVPEDAKNLTELARLFARNHEQSETVKLLSEIINNRKTDRNLRWQAVWVSREIVDNKSDLLNAANFADNELRNALEILADNQIEIKVENPGSQFWFFAGSVAVGFRQNDFAVSAFQNSLIADGDAQNPFGEEGTMQQLMRLYMAKNQPNTAFRLADADKTMKSDGLLSLLADTAAGIESFQRAIDFEKAKLKDVNQEKIAVWQKLDEEKRRKATDFAVTPDNTREF